MVCYKVLENTSIPIFPIDRLYQLLLSSLIRLDTGISDDFERVLHLLSFLRLLSFKKLFKCFAIGLMFGYLLVSPIGVLKAQRASKSSLDRSKVSKFMNGVQLKQRVPFSKYTSFIRTCRLKQETIRIYSVTG